MTRRIEADDDEAAAENPMSPLSGGGDDARPGVVLNSRSDQVSDAVPQASKIHTEVGAAREAVESRERDRSEMNLLRASVAATSAKLGRRADHTERRERDLGEHRESLLREADRIAELAAALDQRAVLLAARERAIDGFFAMLGRMQDAIVVPTVAAIEGTAAAVVDPGPILAAETTIESSSGHDEDGEPTPAVDLSDFTDDERATFAVRRRLRAYSDAFLAAEIRADRNGSKNGKKKRWF